MAKPKEKKIFEQRLKCPYCSRLIHTVVRRVTVKEPVKGETKIEGFLEKEAQTTLEAEYQESLQSGKKSKKQDIEHLKRRAREI